MKIGRRRKAARGVLDRRLHHISERHGPVSAQGLAPGLQRAWHSDGFRAAEILIAYCVEHLRRRARFGTICIGPDRKRNSTLSIDKAMAAIAEPDMRHAAADDADHHRFNHGQRKESGDGGINGVAAGRQHLRACGRGERMITDYHAAAARCRALLALENGSGAVSPIAGHLLLRSR